MFIRNDLRTTIVACIFLAVSLLTARGAAEPWRALPARTLYQYVDSQKLPFHGRWGRCAITVSGDPPDKPMQAIIAGPGRGERREVRGFSIDQIRIVHLDDSPEGQLDIETGPMSNRQAARRQYLFSQDGGLRNIIADGLLFDVVRSPDGRKLLAARSCGVMELAGDICHACGPNVAVVFRWNGRRCDDVTRSYPSYAAETAEAYRRSLLKGDFWSRDYRLGAAMGYYANMAEIGRDGKARRWLRRHLSPSDENWLEDSIPEIRQRLANIPAMVWRMRQAVISAPQT